MSKPWQDKMKGNWNIAKGKLKQKWGELTDDDLDYKESKEMSCWEKYRSVPAKQKRISMIFSTILKY